MCGGIGVERDYKRERIERVLFRARYLDPPDRILLVQVFDRGVRPHQIATLNNLTTRTIQRRVDALCRRLLDPQVVAILRAHSRWSAYTAGVALSVWVKGWTFRQTADRLGISLHEVRQQVQIVRGLIEVQAAK